VAERTWQNFIALDTIHWYCEGPKPTATAHCYNKQAHKHKSITHTFSFNF